MTEAAGLSETSVPVYQATWRQSRIQELLDSNPGRELVSSQIYRVFLTPGGKFHDDMAISTELAPVRNSATTLPFSAVRTYE
jgi:hypothetical protein